MATKPAPVKAPAKVPVRQQKAAEALGRMMNRKVERSKK